MKALSAYFRARATLHTVDAEHERKRIWLQGYAAGFYDGREEERG